MYYHQLSTSEYKTTLKKLIEDTLCGFLIKILQFDRKKVEPPLKEAVKVIFQKMAIELLENKNKVSEGEIRKKVIETTGFFIEDYLDNLNRSLTMKEKKALLKNALRRIIMEKKKT